MTPNNNFRMKIDKIRHQKYILLDEKQSFDIVTLYLGYRC